MTDSTSADYRYVDVETLSEFLKGVKQRCEILYDKREEARTILNDRQASDADRLIMEHRYEKELGLMYSKELELDKALEEARKCQTNACETDACQTDACQTDESSMTKSNTMI